MGMGGSLTPNGLGKKDSSASGRASGWSLCYKHDRIPMATNPAQESDVSPSHVLGSVLSAPEPGAGPGRRHSWLESCEAVPGPLVKLLSMPWRSAHADRHGGSGQRGEAWAPVGRAWRCCSPEEAELRLRAHGEGGHRPRPLSLLRRSKLAEWL